MMKLYLRYGLFLLLLIPPFIYRDYSPNNELMYIGTVEDAFRNQTWFTFYNHGEIYADKPPLYFWLLLCTRALTGSYPMWIIGLFSILPAIGVLAVMDKWVRAAHPEFPAAMANFMLMTTGFFLGSALVVRMDMLMTFFIVLSLYTFYRLYIACARPYERWMLPVYIFLAVFSKGPVGVLVPLVSMFFFLLWKKEVGKMGRYFGLGQWAVLLGLCAVWFTLVYLEGGSEYLCNILFKQTVGRGINSFHHKEPFYYYLQHMPLTFLPWTWLYFSVLLAGASKRMGGSDMERLFGVAIVSTLVMLSFISSKLDIYLLPVYPFMAYLTALWMSRVGDTWYVKVGIALPAVIFALAFPAACFVLKKLPYGCDDLTLGYVALLLMSGGGVGSLVYLWKKRIGKALISSSLGVLLFVAVASVCLPQFDGYVGWRKLAAKGEELALSNRTDTYVFYKFRSGENMDFYLHKPLRRIDTPEDLEMLENASPAVLFVEDWYIKREPELREWLARQGRIFTIGEYKVLIVGRK